jgi:FkbM family methyltransferase
MPDVRGINACIGGNNKQGSGTVHCGCVCSMWWSLENLRKNGFVPRRIIDVGAYEGQWTKLAWSVFPGAEVVMVEANARKRPVLAHVAQQCNGAVSLHIACVGARRTAEVSFFLMDSGGSSVLPENTTFPRVVTSIPMTTLDDLAAVEVNTPQLLKLDVQGYELEVLKGATQTLRHTEVVLLELSLLEYNSGSPLFAEVIGWMSKAGFMAYDICGYARRESDRALFQVDMLFVREGSSLRSNRRFWNLAPPET